MNDHDALLHAIGERPEEDTPRLVYADYLDEQGEPSCAARAEFIRLHVLAARLAYDSPERPSVTERINQLLYAWDVVWQKEMPPGFKTLAFHRRGFAYRATADASQMGLTDDPRLRLIEYLELWTDSEGLRLSGMLTHALFDRVKELVFRGGPLGRHGARTLARATFPRLQRLVLGHQGIGDFGLQTLSESDGFPLLRELDVGHNGISARALEEFQRTALRAQLERVNDWGNLPAPNA